MLGNLKALIYDRKKGLTKTAAVAGGVYVVRGYIRDRLDEVKDRLEQERMARDRLKHRFDQTQENISYTILAMIQTLSEQILGEMDVEGLTLELQTRSKARNAQKKRVERPPSSLSSSVDVFHDHDARSEADSAVISIGSTSIHELEPPSPNISTSGLQNWVESSVSLQRTLEPTGGEEGARRPESMMTTASSARNGESSSVSESLPSDSTMSSSVLSESSNTRSTVELWNEVKILTFTRTLTTLYSTTLLTLLSVIQLTLLARSKYIQHILQLERDERIQEQIEEQFSWTNILLKSGKALEDLMSGNTSALWGEEEDLDLDTDFISEEVESKFLTMSWWILHVGWKDVGERVRRGVEEAFEGVSLKSKLSAADVHRLVSDVRRRVEHEVTFEGIERRINFLSCLLPPTPETVQHVLSQGGFPSQSPMAPYDAMESDDLSVASSQISYLQRQPLAALHPYKQDASFSTLLDELRRIIVSSDFAHVLEVCLDRATEVLFGGLEKSVFVSSDVVAPSGDPVRIRLAGLLPGLARWSHLAMNAIPNQLVDNLLGMREVECLSAIIFSEFENRIR